MTNLADAKAPVLEDRVSISVTPSDALQILSRSEIEQLADASQTELFEIFRRCALAVLNCGAEEDDTTRVLEKYKSFDIKIIQRERGIKLELIDAPASAFVDGEMIQGIREHLFAVLRDVVFEHSELFSKGIHDLGTSSGITDAVFSILRHANALIPNKEPNLIVCWGGHSISRSEYDYAKNLGYEFGLRALDICTGCGSGAMKAPMKGAAIAHSKQRNSSGRYVGISEPGIIAAESPNPIVNELIIMPDIEKRLEAFVRLGHGILVLPGGVGTMEEILYILGVLLHPDNKDAALPLIFSGPKDSEPYFKRIDKFIKSFLGPEAQSRYEIVIDNPVLVSQKMSAAMSVVREKRRGTKDAYYFNWTLKIPEALQQPFRPTHENMATLRLTRSADAFELASNLRKVFSGLVSGNVKAEGQREVSKHGKYRINGDPDLLAALDELLVFFAQQRRMKIKADEYAPCYEIAM